jgi:hypothetical protein
MKTICSPVKLKHTVSGLPLSLQRPLAVCVVAVIAAGGMKAGMSDRCELFLFSLIVIIGRETQVVFDFPLPPLQVAKRWVLCYGYNYAAGYSKGSNRRIPNIGKSTLFIESPGAARYLSVTRRGLRGSASVGGRSWTGRSLK